jgi:cytochrome c oxidase subunit 3/cytochrome o ubiquinol oxidase subunit 3
VRVLTLAILVGGESMAIASESISEASAAPPAGIAGLLNMQHKGKVGMISFLLTEVAFFSTLIMAYVTYIGADYRTNGVRGPTPVQVFSMGLVLVSTVCLLSSSVTIHMAGLAEHRNQVGAFRLWWGLTIGLGILFLIGTGIEWHDLIVHHRLLPWTNLFGTTYFTLVGFHAFHVTIGIVIMTMLLGFSLVQGLPARQPLHTELVSWYWHFVDAVWIAVFTVVYLVSRNAS